MQFHVENMTCGGCVRRITTAVQSIDPAAQVQADPGSRTLVVISRQQQGGIEAVLAEVGYPAALAA